MLSLDARGMFRLSFPPLVVHAPFLRCRCCSNSESARSHRLRPSVLSSLSARVLLLGLTPSGLSAPRSFDMHPGRCEHTIFQVLARDCTHCSALERALLFQICSVIIVHHHLFACQGLCTLRSSSFSVKSLPARLRHETTVRAQRVRAYALSVVSFSAQQDAACREGEALTSLGRCDTTHSHARARSDAQGVQKPHCWPQSHAPRTNPFVSLRKESWSAR